MVQEGYVLKFLGKSYAKLLASTETTTVIQPNEAHNSLPENTNSENIYISGDNLDGLKHLLKSYNGAIKCIYIDPPYNTGSDGFVYADNFNYTKDTLQEKLSVSEEEAERILDLTKRGSASHSAWLMFMYSRLLLARDLLKDDGVIFISIDDNEQANLKLLCDDVFGEENLIAQFIWQKAAGNQNDNEYVAISHEYVVCYARKKENVYIYNLPPTKEMLKTYSEVDEFVQEREKYYLRNLNDFSIGDRPGLHYDIICPDGSVLKGNEHRWRCDEDRFNWRVVNKRIVFEKNEDSGWQVFYKQYLFETKEQVIKDSTGKILSYGKIPDTMLIKVASTGDGSKEIKDRFNGKAVFSYPKPTSLIKHLISIASANQDIILDFFSGSASSADAVLSLNIVDDCKRKFISIQLPQVLSPDVDSQKIAYEFLKENNLPTTLDYIGIERIKRAAAKIKEEHPDKEMDLGFKHYILQEPNQNTLDKLDSFDKAGLLADTTIMEEFGKPTILATWLNADGYGLTVQAASIDLAGYTAYYCQKHMYLIDPGFTLESMKALLSKYDAEGHFNPENMVLFGYSFPDWSINEMIEKNLRILNDGEKNLKINFTVRY